MPGLIKPPMIDGLQFDFEKPAEPAFHPSRINAVEKFLNSKKAEEICTILPEHHNWLEEKDCLLEWGVAYVNAIIRANNVGK